MAANIPRYPLEDELLSARDNGLQKEIEADLKTLDDLNLDSFLDDSLHSSKDENIKEDEKTDREEPLKSEDNSVDEDNFFLENEEANRRPPPPAAVALSAGQVLQKCFQNVLGLQVLPRPSPSSASKDPTPLDPMEDLSDSDDTLSVDEIFDAFLSSEDDEDASVKAFQVPNLSCPYVTVGCTFLSNQPRLLAAHLKKMHKQLMLPKECCGFEFETRMDYDNHRKSEHNQ